MTEQLSRRSLLKLAPAGAVGAAALAAAATQVAASPLDPQSPSEDFAALPLLTHADELVLTEKSAVPTTGPGDNHMRVFALHRTGANNQNVGGDLFAQDDAGKIWPASQRIYVVEAYRTATSTDQQAIQAAVNAAVADGGGVVELGDASKTYTIGSHITLGSNIVLRGQATIKLDGTAVLERMILVPVGSSHVVIEDITVDGNAGAYPLSQAGMSGIRVANNSTSVTTRDVVIRGITIKDIAGFGIEISTNNVANSEVYKVRIEGCLISGTRKHGIKAQRAPGVIISGNIITGTRDTADTGSTDGIWCGHGSPRAVIVNNYIEDCQDMGIEVYSNSQGGVLVANNRIHKVKTMGISLAGTPNSTISGNVLTEIGSPEFTTAWVTGIELASSSGTIVAANAIEFEPAAGSRTGADQYKGIVVNDSHYVSISGGTIRSAEVGVRLSYGSDHVNISGLVVENPLNWGVEVAASGAVEYLSIQGNTFTNVGKRGLEVSGGSVKHLSLRNNVITMASSGLNGLWVPAGNSNIMLANNVIAHSSTNTQDAIVVGGCTDVIITGNRITGFGMIVNADGTTSPNTDGRAINLPNGTDYVIIVANDLRGNRIAWGSLPANRQEGFNLLP